MKAFLLYSLILLLGLTTCQKSNHIHQTEWILGTWEQKTSRGIVFETWEKISDRELRAKSYLLNDSDTVLMETVSLLQKEDNLFYIPTVPNQNKGQAVFFALTSIDQSVMVFENPDHDFPQKIMYRKAGQDSLVAEISGIREGKESRRLFPMKKKR